MKKVILYVGAAFLFISSINAQSKKNEIDLGVGTWSSNQIVGVMTDMIVTGLPNGVTMKDGSYIGALHLGYKYSLFDRFALGPVVIFDCGTSDAEVSNGKLGTITSNFYTIALEADYKYINRNRFRLYSLIGVGGSHLYQTYKPNETGDIQSQRQTFLNFQVTPIGMKFGNTFGAFAELGFGYKGLLTLGLFTRF